MLTEEIFKHHLQQSCCISTYLPKSLMQAPHRALSFHTSGDVSMEKFYRAISHLIVAPHVMVIAMPNMTNETAAFFLQCFERKWITDLVLSTSRNVSDLLRKYLSDYKQHILYAVDKNVTETSSHLVLYSDQQSLSITGPMFETMLRRHLVSYTLLFQSRYDLDTAECSSPLRNILFPDMLRMRKTYNPTDQTTPRSWRLTRFLNMTLPPYED